MLTTTNSFPFCSVQKNPTHKRFKHYNLEKKNVESSGESTIW